MAAPVTLLQVLRKSIQIDVELSSIPTANEFVKSCFLNTTSLKQSQNHHPKKCITYYLQQLSPPVSRTHQQSSQSVEVDNPLKNRLLKMSRKTLYGIV